MNSSRAAIPFRRADLLELRACQAAITWSNQHGYTPLFQKVSRLGDGIFWYGLMAAIALFDPALALFYAMTGLICTSIYKSLKHILIRERPFITHPSIISQERVLDRYSFPSGHTLHAVCFTVVLFGTFPGIAIAVLPFTLLVAMSRVTLGLHYPSDVIAGALIGGLLGFTSLAFLDGMNLSH